MAGHPDILDQREQLRNPVLGSVGLHAAILAATLLAGYLKPARQMFGDANSFGGGSVSITPVSRIALPSQPGRVNPVASPAESTVPQPPPKPEARKRVEPKPDAVPIKSRNAPKREARADASQQIYRPPREERPNQLYSPAGQALTSPMFATSGSGNVGVGASNPFGNRFGAYSALIQEAVGRKWRTNDVDLRLQTAPPVIASFELYRDGSVRNIRLLQRSGNYALDVSAQRAITEAAPLPPLPREFEGSMVTIEFWFQLKR